MAMAAPVSIHWLPEDDLLLKHAVENGASLEALAKGAVQFSRKYSLKELQDRWYSLLYDADVSAHAATRMFELELSGFSPLMRNSRNDHSRGNKEVIQKRKIGNIRKQYNSMRKKFRNEFFNPADLGFLDEPILPDGSGQVANFPGFNGDPQNVVGNPVPDNLEFHEAEIEVLQTAFSKPDGSSTGVDNRSMYLTGCSNKHEVKHPNGSGGVHESGVPQSLEMHRLSVFDSRTENPKNVIRGSRQEHHLSSTMGVAYSSAQPNQPLSDTVQGADDMLTDNGKGTNSFGYDADHSGPICGVSEGEFGDLPDSLLNLSNEDGILLTDVDGKETLEQPCPDHLNSLLLTVAREDGISDLEPEKIVASVNCLANPSCLPHEKSDAITSSFNCDDPNIHHPEDIELLDPTLAFDYHDLGIDDGNVICTLNVEDPEIPCNDDIFLLIHPSSSRGASASQPSRGVQGGISAASRKINEPRKPLIMDIKDVSKYSNWSQKTGPNILPASPMSLIPPKIKTELRVPYSKVVLSKVVEETIGDLHYSGSSHANASASASGKPVDGILRLDSKVGVASATLPGVHTAAGGSANVVIPGALLNLSDMEESESDDDVPCFSDVEAMILDMELDPQHEDTHKTKLVPKYHTEAAKKSIIRMEQSVQSCIQRALTSLGAFAVFYGRHLKHYIKKTEVILGRSTDDAAVDIDLRKEGRANKISRQQAIVKMEANGSFYLKNLGKSVISVNGKAVAKGQLICLSLSCLIEIRGMCFIFETNPRFIKQYMAALQKNQGKKSNLPWLPGEAAKAH